MGSQSIPAKPLNLGVLDRVPLLSGNRLEQAVQWAGELGLGRAPGGGPHASMALSGNFLQHVAEQPHALWMLGTNRKSAEYAARYSTGYVFGPFMSEQDAGEMLSIYRSGRKF
ncbi:UNVERIFIED_CONTAM: alkanesulfonate monooxygenase SsuD/methylene tetrahydromethanopterin reductase-like flavin-dependent oxidoreductase (luciferase family) [Paenibacillus sp. PvR008]